jgi:hypothetical protein
MIAVPAGNTTQMVGQYVAEKAGCEFAPGMYTAFAVMDENHEFVAGVVFSNYRKWDIEMSVASETPLAWRPNVLRALYAYVFEQLGCVRCTSITTRSNRKARGFLERLGFQLEGNLRSSYDGRRDALVYGLLRAECRFLADDSEGINEQEHSTGPAAPGPGSDGAGPVSDE